MLTLTISYREINIHLHKQNLWTHIKSGDPNMPGPDNETWCLHIAIKRTWEIIIVYKLYYGIVNVGTNAHVNVLQQI